MITFLHIKYIMLHFTYYIIQIKFYILKFIRVILISKMSLKSTL